VTECPCCARLVSASEDHACALAFGEEDLIIVSRSMVKLAAITTDLRHGLGSRPDLVSDYQEAAREGRVIAVVDPIATARRVAP
jgi:hypothetical protein